MSHKITAMNHVRASPQILRLAILVVFASLFGLPVSTTHVSVGSLFGIGLTTGKANPRAIKRDCSFLADHTACAAILGGSIYWVTKSFPFMNRFCRPTAQENVVLRHALRRSFK